MYIKPTCSGYDSSGQQFSRRQLFLMLVQPKIDSTWENDSLRWHTDRGITVSSLHAPEYPIRAIVRKVAMQQCGHWMMGTARVKDYSLTVSGSYGGDGLPMSVPHDVYNESVDVPEYLIKLWNKGGGWNSCGNEAKHIRKWALENIGQLYRVR